MAFVPLSRDALERRYGEFFERRTVPLDAKKVPPAFRSLILYAEIWGVKDDIDRGLLVEGAPPAAKADLLALGGEFDAPLDAWLAGPEAESSPLSAEYVAFSNMRMAFDYLSVLT
ncbi:MAG TPA: hypothetical protein VFA20_08105 [Myxococcaceae bacterium]|nr:hypothetical protein [Myxococcaceae bacterium]